jgi:hypothetical protein
MVSALRTTYKAAAEGTFQRMTKSILTLWPGTAPSHSPKEKKPLDYKSGGLTRFARFVNGWKAGEQDGSSITKSGRKVRLDIPSGNELLFNGMEG